MIIVPGLIIIPYIIAKLTISTEIIYILVLVITILRLKYGLWAVLYIPGIILGAGQHRGELIGDRAGSADQEGAACSRRQCVC